jgi:hypothetical protein
VGDVLVSIDDRSVRTYEDAMRVLPGCVYPLTLQFRRGAAAVTNNSNDLQTFAGDVSLRGSFERDRMRLEHQSATGSAPSSPSRRRLSPDLMEDEVELIFTEVCVVVFHHCLVLSQLLCTQSDLGFRIEELVGHEIVSIVDEVTLGGAAELHGVRVGWTLVGINHEKYISHAHSTATLKYVKKPVTIRFRVTQQR